MTAWQPAQGSRGTLNEPVPIDVIYYGLEGHETHRRLMGEFPKILDSFEARYKEGRGENNRATILSFTPQNR